jgi:hypothetical protein
MAMGSQVLQEKLSTLSTRMMFEVNIRQQPQVEALLKPSARLMAKPV